MFTPKIRVAAAAAGLLVTLGAFAAPAVAGSPAPTVTTSAAESQHGFQLQAGPVLRAKYHFATEYLGTIETGGRLGYCVDYGKAGPDGSWTTGTIPASAAARSRMAWLVNTYWKDGLTSNRAAAALKASLNRLASPEFASDWASSYVGQLRRIDPGVAPLSDLMLTRSRAAGPVKAVAGFGSKPLPGGTGTATVTVTGNGKPLVGAQVTWALAGAKVTRADGVTSAVGTAAVTFVRTSTGPVSSRVTVNVAEWRKAGVSTATSGHQHLVRGSYTTPVDGATAYDSAISATVSQACEPVCTGHPPVVLSAPAASVPVRWVATVAGKVVGRKTFAAGQSGHLTVTGTDGVTVAFAYQVRVAGRWSVLRQVKALTVVCPPWPTASLPIVCLCKGTRDIPVSFTVPASTRFYTVTVTAGDDVQTASLVGGGTTTLTVTPSPGTRVVASFVSFADAAHTVQLSAQTIGDVTVNS